MKPYEKIVKYLAAHAGTEQSISEATGIPVAEVFRIMTGLLGSDKVEIYQSQSGDEMYRMAPKVCMVEPGRRPSTAPSWSTPMHLENAWTTLIDDKHLPLTVDDKGQSTADDGLAIVDKDTLPDAEPDVPKKRTPKPRAPKKRKATPFTPMSWEEKSANVEQYTSNYYKSL